MKKYILHPGYIYSIFDGDKHYVSAFQLCLLYGVTWSKCVVASPYNGDGNLIPLYPKSNGNYNLKKQVPGCFLFSSEDWKI